MLCPPLQLAALNAERHVPSAMSTYEVVKTGSLETAPDSLHTPGRIWSRDRVLAVLLLALVRLLADGGMREARCLRSALILFPSPRTLRRVIDTTCKLQHQLTHADTSFSQFVPLVNSWGVRKRYSRVPPARFCPTGNY